MTQRQAAFPVSHCSPEDLHVLHGLLGKAFECSSRQRTQHALRFNVAGGRFFLRTLENC